MANEPGEAMMEVAKTISVPEAARRYFDLGRNASYDAAKRGEIPVIKIGSRLRVPLSALDRMLEEAGAPKKTSAQ
jgi:excisionase family DNA binding protein